LSHTKEVIDVADAYERICKDLPDYKTQLRVAIDTKKLKHEIDELLAIPDHESALKLARLSVEMDDSDNCKKILCKALLSAGTLTLQQAANKIDFNENTSRFTIKLGKTKELQKAYEYAREAYQLQNSPDVAYAYALRLTQQGKSEEALTALNKALIIDPEDGKLNFLYALLLQQKEIDWINSFKSIDIAVKAESDNFLYQYIKWAAYASHGQSEYKEASDALRNLGFKETPKIEKFGYSNDVNFALAMLL
jgi:tetratricopeptide (TPR) repeat protein